MEGRGGGKTWEVFFTTKSYFLQVKSLILVGTLEKYQFLILTISIQLANRSVDHEGNESIFAPIGARQALE
ncbi:hypothetical protein LBHB_16190 [Leptospira borgpetersenii serovar Hardjo]|nr:hypothetical protein LBHB_16190 [Leptospira borgpetersenii serovar Hardjo]